MTDTAPRYQDGTAVDVGKLQALSAKWANRKPVAMPKGYDGPIPETGDEALDAYNLGRAAVGLAPAKHYGECADEWDLVLVEHHECAMVLRSAGIEAFDLSEPWQEHIEKGTRVLLVDRAMRISGDLRKNYPVGEVLMVRTPLPYRFPSEFLQARMDVARVTLADKPAVRELWRICSLANRTWICDTIDPTGHPDSLPPPKVPQTAPWSVVAGSPSPDWVLESLIAKDSIVMLASASTAGKSLLTIDWCLRMIHGMSWFGQHMQPGSVLYLCGEGWGGIGGRIRGWLAANPAERPQRDHYLEFSQGIPTLSTPAGCRELGVMIERFAKRYGHPPKLVVVDTLSQAFGEGDENDASTVAPALKALADLRAMFHFAILVLHHTRKGDGPISLSSVRGSGALTANVDIVLGIEVQDDVRTLRTLKLKDGEVAPPIRFEIRGQETGRVLQFGAAERAPVIIPSNQDGPAKTQPPAVDQEIHTLIGMAGSSGLTVTRLEDLSKLEPRVVFESLSRMERQQTIVKSGTNPPRYYWSVHAPKEKQ